VPVTGRRAVVPAGERTVRRRDEVGPLEPPMPEELGIERRDDDVVPGGVVFRRDGREEIREVLGVLARAVGRGVRPVGMLRAEIPTRRAEHATA